MPLLRKSSEDQLKKWRKIVKDAGGDIADKVSKDEQKLPNLYYMHNPSDSKIDTYEDNYSTGNNTKITNNKMNNHVKTFEQYQLMLEDKNVDILRVGKNIDLGDIKGIINRIDGKNVYIETKSDDGSKIVEVPMSKVFKVYSKNSNDFGKNYVDAVKKDNKK